MNGTKRAALLLLCFAPGCGPSVNEEDATSKPVAPNAAEQERIDGLGGNSSSFEELDRLLKDAQREAPTTETEPGAGAVGKADPRCGFCRALEATGFVIRNKGVANSYRQISELTVYNKSAPTVVGIRGQIEWIKGDGKTAGTVPFTLEGVIGFHETKKFTTNSDSLVNDAVATDADTARIRFTSAWLPKK